MAMSWNSTGEEQIELKRLIELLKESKRVEFVTDYGFTTVPAIRLQKAIDQIADYNSQQHKTPK